MSNLSSVVRIGVRRFHVRLLVAGLCQLLVERFVLLVRVERASTNLGGGVDNSVDEKTSNEMSLVFITSRAKVTLFLEWVNKKANKHSFDLF